MAEIRTLKLNLLADVDQFSRGLKGARGDVDNLGYKLGEFAKKAGKYFAIAAAAASAYAVKIGVDSVRAAVDDEQSQRTLAKALENSTKATADQVKAVENYIRQSQLATGVSDNQLRPAFANLSRATGDLTKAQKLTNLALDISASTGKDVESVSLALAKAYNGNIGALTRLGIPLDESIKKTKDFDEAQQKLTELFGGAAAANAETYAGKLAIVSQKVGEAKESFGVLLLPVVERLVDFGNKKFLPFIEDVIQGFKGKNDTDGLTGTALKVAKAMGYDENTPGQNLGRALFNVAAAMQRLIDVLTNSETDDGISNINKIANGFQSIANGIDAMARAYNIFKQAAGASAKVFGNIDRATGYNPFLGFANGGTVRAGMPVTVGEMGKEIFVPNTSGQIIPNNKLGGTTIVNLNGIIDGESARRTIEKLLQDSARRTGAINLLGATL